MFEMKTKQEVKCIPKPNIFTKNKEQTVIIYLDNTYQMEVTIRNKQDGQLYITVLYYRVKTNNN